MATFVAIIVFRVSLLVAVAAVMTALMRRSSAAARHLVWTCALAGSLIVPVLSMVVPAWELPVLPAVQTRTFDPMPEAPTRTDVAPPSFARQRQLPAERPATTDNSTVATNGTAQPILRLATRPASIWLFGLLIVVARLALGTARMQWIARRATRVGSGRWMRLAERLAGVLGVGRRVVFLEGTQVAMPMTWGVVTSRVLLPKSAEAWPPRRQRVVLLHELAHVKRRDCL
ncbi:MAG: M56 family metallopeptidase, partial [Acidobacteriota bacterium]